MTETRFSINTLYTSIKDLKVGWPIHKFGTVEKLITCVNRIWVSVFEGGPVAIEIDVKQCMSGAWCIPFCPSMDPNATKGSVVMVTMYY